MPAATRSPLTGCPHPSPVTHSPPGTLAAGRQGGGAPGRWRHCCPLLHAGVVHRRGAPPAGLPQPLDSPAPSETFQRSQGREAGDSQRALTPAKSRGTSARGRRTALGLHPRAGPALGTPLRCPCARVHTVTRFPPTLCTQPGTEARGSQERPPFQGPPPGPGCRRHAINGPSGSGVKVRRPWGPKPRSGGPGTSSLFPDTGYLFFHPSTHPSVCLTPVSAMY